MPPRIAWNYFRDSLVHVDFETQRRTPKASARLYSEVIRTRGACL